MKVRGHLEKYEKILRQRKFKKLKKLTKSNKFLFFERLGQFDSHEPFFSFKHQFLKFCNSFVPDFENLHNLIHLNDVSDANTTFNDSSISDSENSKSSEGTPSSNVQGNEAEMCDGRLKGEFVSKNVINLSKRNLSENEISLLSKGLNFIPTCNKVDVARLKIELERFGRMLRLKCHFRNDKRDIPINPFKAKSTFNPRNTDAAIEIYLSSLEEKLLKVEVPKDKLNNLTKGERDAFYNIKNDKTIVIKGADKGSAVVVWDREDYIKEAENQLGDTKSYEEVPNDAKPLMIIILSTLENIRKCGDICTDTLKYFLIKDAKFARLYLLPKIHKRLYNVPGRPVILNCGYYTENIS